MNQYIMMTAAVIIAMVMISSIKNKVAARERAAEHAAEDTDSVKAIYRVRRYAVEVTFSDGAGTTLRYENITEHSFRDGMAVIVFSGGYVSYIPVANIRRLLILPMDNGSRTKCEEYDVTPEDDWNEYEYDDDDEGEPDYEDEDEYDGEPEYEDEDDGNTGGSIRVHCWNGDEIRIQKDALNGVTV